MSQLFANNIATTLSSAITTVGQSTCVVASATGMPTPTAPDYFYITLSDASETVWEVCKVTGRSGTTLTITRGQDGTSAATWPIGTNVQIRPNAGTLRDMQYTASEGVFTPEMYGAKADGTTDDSSAITSASAAAAAYESTNYRTGAILKFAPGKIYACASTVTIKSNTYGVGAELLFPQNYTGVALSVGTSGSGAVENKIMYLPSVICTRSDYTNWDATPNSVGVQVNGAQYCEIHATGIRNFAVGLKMYASGGYFVGYNDVFLGMLLDNKVQIMITQGDSNGQSWINENRFHGGRLSQSSNFGTDKPGVCSIYIKQFATAGAITTTQTMSIVQSTKVVTWAGGDFTAAGFYVGGLVTFTGWANSASNGTFRVAAVGTTTMTLASNVTVGADETNKASVTAAMEQGTVGSIPNNNNFFGVSMESDVAEAIVVIRGGTLNNFYGCRFERGAGATIFLFGMKASTAVANNNNFYGGYTNAGADLVLTVNSWAVQNSAIMANRIAMSSNSTYGPLSLMNQAGISNPVITVWSVNNVTDSTVFKPTGTNWLAQFGGYYLDMKPAASSVPKLRIGGSPGEIYFGDGTTALGAKFQVYGTNDGVGMSGGNLAVVSAGKGMRVAEGSNAKQGTATLTAGSATVSNTSVTANSRIFLTSNADGGTPGWLRVSARSNGTSFTITSSSGTDTSTVAWEIFEPA